MISNNNNGQLNWWITMNHNDGKIKTIIGIKI